MYLGVSFTYFLFLCKSLKNYLSIEIISWGLNSFFMTLEWKCMRLFMVSNYTLCLFKYKNIFHVMSNGNRKQIFFTQATLTNNATTLRFSIVWIVVVAAVSTMIWLFNMSRTFLKQHTNIRFACEYKSFHSTTQNKISLFSSLNVCIYREEQMKFFWIF